MMNTTILSDSRVRTAITDLVVLVLVYFLPALTHYAPFPLWNFEPMRLLLFSAYLITRNSSNAYLLAVTIPVFSSLVSPHPAIYKGVLMSAELLVNVVVFEWLVKKIKWHPAILFIIATVFSKLFYYLFKYFFIQWQLVDGPLIKTGIDIQLYVIVVLAILFAFFYKRKTA